MRNFGLVTAVTKADNNLTILAFDGRYIRAMKCPTKAKLGTVVRFTVKIDPQDPDRNVVDELIVLCDRYAKDGSRLI